MPILTRKCLECGTRYDVLEVGGRIIGNLSRPDGEEDRLGCLVCNSMEYENVVATIQGVVTEEYPRFDRGLNLMLTSAAHRAQVCRERGLVPVDGDVDLGPTMAEQAADNMHRARYAAYQERLKHDSAFAGYRRYAETELADLMKARKQDVKNGNTPRERL